MINQIWHHLVCQLWDSGLKHPHCHALIPHSSFRVPCSAFRLCSSSIPKPCYSACLSSSLLCGVVSDYQIIGQNQCSGLLSRWVSSLKDTLIEGEQVSSTAMDNFSTQGVWFGPRSCICQLHALSPLRETSSPFVNQLN